MKRYIYKCKYRNYNKIKLVGVIKLKLLVPMNENEYNTYVKDKKERYALTLEGNTFEITNETPLNRAEKAINNYLTDGFNTKYHEFYNVVSNGDIVGYVWIKVIEESKSAFLYEIFLKDMYRSKGIGKKVMTELELLLSHRKISYFKLHVFGNNVHAINLYSNLGFNIAGINMYKELTK